jgi:hypothetical protein
MERIQRPLWIMMGFIAGLVGAVAYFGQAGRALAANDRYDDYIICTGAVQISPRLPMDGVWLLDYRNGKLLGTVIDRNVGKITGWAEADLVSEFGIAPRENVHFVMTTGNVAVGQAALYIAETTTGKFGVYTLGPRTDGQAGVVIQRHDITSFRQSKNTPPGT